MIAYDFQIKILTTHVLFVLEANMETFLDTQIRDIDTYSDTDSTKHDFDISNQTLDDC